MTPTGSGHTGAHTHDGADNDWLPCDAAAALANVTERTIRNWVRAGRIRKRIDPNDRRPRFSREDLLAQLATLPGPVLHEEASAASRHTANGTSPPAVNDDDPRTEHLLAQLSDQIDWLKDRVIAAEQAESELRRLLLLYFPGSLGTGERQVTLPVPRELSTQRPRATSGLRARILRFLARGLRRDDDHPSRRP